MKGKKENNVSKPSKFNPTHEELVHYLYKKVIAERLPDDVILREYDLYGEKEPWEIWDIFGGPSLEKGQDLFFFTRLKKKSPKPESSRINRRVGPGTGTWICETPRKEVNACGKLMGHWRMFKYGLSLTPQDGRWIMHEYVLNPSSLQQTQSNDYVLCRIKKNDRALEKKREPQENNSEKLGKLQESGREKKPKPMENRKNIESKHFKSEEVQENWQMELTCTNSIEPAQSHETVDTDLQQQSAYSVAVVSTDVALMEHLSNVDELVINFEGLHPEKEVSKTGNTGSKSTTQQPLSDEESMDLVLLPLASLPTSAIAPGGANKVVEDGINAKEQKSTLPQLTCTSSPSTFTIDYTGFIETYASVETYYGDEHYNDEAIEFAKELLKNQPQNAMEENDIILLPNMYFADNWVRGWEAVP